MSGLPYEIIVSDDASADDSVSFLQKEFPSVKLIINGKNRGFSPTINKGIVAAGYDYILLLNSDVMLSENYFIPLLRYFEKDDTFGVMGRIVGWDDDLIQDAAKYPSFHGVKIKTTGNYLSETPAHDEWLYSMYLSGANALIDKKKLISLQGFDEIFAPFYVEDYELSLRAWRLGWKCYYEHFAVCRHQISISIKSKSSKNYINTIYYRNKMFLHAIHLSNGKLILWYLQQIPETFIRLITGRFYYLNSLNLFLKNQRQVKRSKEKLVQLSHQTGKLFSVNKIVKVIRYSLKDKKIKRF